MSERKVVRELRRQGFKVLRRRKYSRFLSIYRWRRANRVFVGAADHAFAHITDTHDTGDVIEDARTVERIGVERFGTGWSYNWGLHPSTRTIIVGQPMDAAGAHTLNDKNVPGFHENLNYWGHAIAFIGRPGDEFGDWERKAAAAIIRAERKHGHMKETARLYPHSKFAFKDCPCDPYRDSIPEIEKLSRKPNKDARLVAANMRHDRAGWQKRLSELRALAPNVAFLCECNQLHDAIKEKFPDYAYVGDDSTRSRRDCVLLLRRPNVGKLKLAERGFFKISRNVDSPKRISHDRYVAWAKVEHGDDKYLLCSVHLNAVVQDKESGLALSLKLRRVYEYRRGIRRLRRFLKANPDWKPVIGGDVNWRRRGAFLDTLFSPDRLFRRFRLTVFSHGLDRIAYPKTMRNAGRATFDATNADHKWLVQDVEL